MTQTPTTTAIEPVVIERDDSGLQVFTSQHTYLMAIRAPRATPAEVQMHLMQAQRLDLDPFTGQIWLVPRKDNSGQKVHRTEIGIAGFRQVAHRSGVYGGPAPYLWLNASGEWVDVWTSATEHPIAARCEVVRTDHQRPYVGTVTWAEGAVGYRKDGKFELGPLWKGRPSFMLAKCAEVQALRQAFPDLSGVLLRGEVAGGDAPADQIEAVRVDEIPADVKTIWHDVMAHTAQMPDAKAFKDHVMELLADEGMPLDKFAASSMDVHQAIAVLEAAINWNGRPFDGEEE